MLEIAIQVVAAAATVVAVYFAYRAAHDTRSLRREERLFRLPDLLDDLIEKLVLAYQATYVIDRPEWVLAHSAREQLRAAVAASGQHLPACEALLRSPIFPDSEQERASVHLDDLWRAATAATDELITVFHRRETGPREGRLRLRR